MDAIVALVALLSLLFYLWTGVNVGRVRHASGINAPTMTGDPRLERAVRVQTNTLEWLPIYLVSLFLFDAFTPKPYGAWAAAALGLIWIGARVLYMTAYMADPARRGPGFGVQALCCLILLVGALVGVVMALVRGA